MAINAIISQPSQTATAAPANSSALSQKTAQIMQAVLKSKEINKDKALAARANFLEGTLIAGDLLTMGSMTFQGTLILSPSLSAISAVTIANLVCGVLAGIIDIGVSLLCLKSGIIHWKNGDKAAAYRQFFNFAIYSAIGLVMTLVSLAIQVGAFSSLSLFFAANPWLLPVLFFVAGLPTFYEVVNRIYKAKKEQDLGSDVLKGQLDNLIQKLNLNGCDQLVPNIPKDDLEPLFERIKKELRKEDLEDTEKKIASICHELYKNIDEQVEASLEAIALSEKLSNLDSQNKSDKIIEEICKFSFLSRKLELLSSDMGVEAAIATFKLLQSYIADKNQDHSKELDLAKRMITKWNRAQYVRLAQRILYTAAFGLSMGLLAHPNEIASAVESFAMAGASAIPFGMDAFWPFKRNTPLGVEKAEVELHSLNSLKT